MTLLSSMRRQCVVPMVAVALAAGCATDIPSFANRFTTPGERAFPRSYLQLLADGRLDSAFSLLAPELRTDTTRRVMGQVAALLRDAQLDSMRLIGVNTASFGTGSHDVKTSVTSWKIRTRPRTSPFSAVSGATLNPRCTTVSSARLKTMSERSRGCACPALNHFALSGKTAAHYIWLTLALLMPIVTITVAVFVARARGMPRRWLWVVASLIATPAFFINWTTGKVGFSNGWFLLFGGAATSAGPAAPWIVAFALPIGAGIAYLKVRRWRQGTHPTPGTGTGEVAA